MKQGLHYGRISWSYEDDCHPSAPDRLSPFVTFNPIRINNKLITPTFSDKIALKLFKYKTDNTCSFREAYKEWYLTSFIDRDLGEGRSFLRWLYRQERSIKWRPNDFKLHPFFTAKDAPRHDENDEMAKGLSFAIRPVEVNKRKVKLYLTDDAVLNLISLPYGHDTDFIELVCEYVRLRFEWEKLKAPAPTFLDWVKAQVRRPVFMQGQIGFCP